MAGILSITDPNDPYFIDSRQRVKDVQTAMQKEGIDAYVGSRPRTLSWIVDAFCPWRSYVVIPAEGMPTLFTFFIDVARISSETWMDEENVRGYFGIEGMLPIPQIAKFIQDELKVKGGRIGYEDGISTYTPEGFLTNYELENFKANLPGAEFVNAHPIIDRLSLIKDRGTINRFREASRIADVGHEALREAISNGGYKNLTETEVAGIAALAMRRAGSVSEWNFAGLNEISTGWRTGLGACTPPTTKKLAAGEPCMFDLHSMFRLGLGDHCSNYLIAPATERQLWHADNFVALINLLLDSYKAGETPASLLAKVMGLAQERGCADYVLPAVEHGIGLFGDEWRVGAETDAPMPYWTHPGHVYQENELVIAAMQYVCQAEGIGFRYENPTVILKDRCEFLSKYPFRVEVIE